MVTLLLVNQVHDEPAELGRVLDLVLRLAEDDAEHALLFAERFKHMPVMRLQLIPVARQQTGPGELLGHGGRLVERRTRLLIRHLEEQQKRQLLHIIAVGQTVIAENVAVIPELLDELGGVASHRNG